MPVFIFKLFFHSFNLSIASFSTSEAIKTLLVDSFKVTVSSAESNPKIDARP